VSEPIKITLSREAASFVRADAPREARLMAARGALPMGPSELATVLFLLSRDADPEVSGAAAATVAGLPATQAHRAVEGALAPPILDFLARRRPDDPALLERIALSPHAADATIAFLASLPHKGLVEIISNNQVRILRAPAIVDALGGNPLTGRAAIDRILAFLGLEGKLARVTAEPEPGEAGDIEAPRVLADAALVEQAGIAGDRTDDLPTELVQTEEELRSAEQAPNQAKIDKQNLMSLLQTLTVFQKIRLARLGNKEARGLLIRDRNKIVATSAIRSPKVTENEVVVFAKSRNVNDEVPRIIATNREWTKNYQIQHALVGNPKTPLLHSLKFINYLQDRDLRGLAKSKDVPRQIATAARRLLAKKKGDA
jgi:hypothetical protein